jgi:hypothetical protein
MRGNDLPFAPDIEFGECEKAILGRKEFRVTVKENGAYRVVNCKNKQMTLFTFSVFLFWLLSV